MNLAHNEQLREQLAAEYVLGTLKGGARRRFEKLAANDPILKRAVAEWQDRLCPLAEFNPAQQPSPQVWHALQTRLHLPAAHAKPGFWSGWRDSLHFWRGLGVASTAMAAILLTVMLARQPELMAPAPSYVATLSDDKAQTTMVVTGDTQRRQLIVRVVTPAAIAADKSLELWALPKDGAPRSLGLVAANGTVVLPLPENTSPQTVAALAISLEPKGGSPNPNAPSGPVLYKGAWVQI